MTALRGRIGALLSGLRIRLVAAFVLVAGTIIVIVHGHLPGVVEREATRMATARAAHLAETVAFGVSAALFFGDAEAVEEVVAQGRGDPDVAYIRVEDAAGALVAVYTKGDVLPEREAGVLRIGRTVEYPTQRVGRVYVGLSLLRVESAVAAVRHEIRVLGTAVFVIGLLSIWLLTGLVLEPLRRVSAAAAAVREGDMTRRARTGSRDEVGELGRTFDAMLDRLAAAHAGLREANRTLEERVAARTAELQAQVEETLRAEGALRASEARFRAVFDHSAAGVAVFEPGGSLLQANRALADMLGVRPAELRGRRLCDLLHLDDEAARRVDGVMAGLGDAEFEVPLRSTRPLQVWGHLSLSSVRADSGVEMLIAVVEDTTQRRELEERVRHGQKMEAVGRLAGGVAHDFNNLLTTINGVTDLLLTELPPDSPLQSDLQEIHAAGDRAAALTRQLLAFSRRQVLQPQTIDPNDVVLDLSRMLRRLLGETIELRLELDPQAGTVRADPGQLGQVLINLAVNARDAMAGGGTMLVQTSQVVLDARAAERFGTSTLGPHVHLMVADTGVGMEAGVLARAFEPFFTTKELGQGTGLGLPTVYGIVQQSGGGIMMTSEPGSGTRVQVVLPVAAGGARTDRVRSKGGEPGGSETVLVVEDEPGVRALVCRVLRRAGYHVLEAGEPGVALELARTYPDPIDLVVSDVVMPGLPGPEFTRRLLGERPGTQVLYMSGYNESEVLRHGISAETTAFIQKPMTPAALATKVRALLDARAGAGSEVAHA